MTSWNPLGADEHDLAQHAQLLDELHHVNQEDSRLLEMITVLQSSRVLDSAQLGELKRERTMITESARRLLQELSEFETGRQATDDAK